MAAFLYGVICASAVIAVAWLSWAIRCARIRHQQRADLTAALARNRRDAKSNRRTATGDRS